MLRRIREEFTKEYRGIVIDDRALYEEIRGYVEAITPELAERVEYYDAEEEGLPIFERFHISEQLLKALDRKVWLPSGGSLIIERTEALTVIDVNTGKNVGKSNLEETVFRNNLEAAEEVARQLRLRDIGGIIVIDFVDMEIKNEPRRDHEGLPRRPGPRQDPHPGVRDVGARAGRDDPQAHLRGSGGVVQRHLPDLPRPGVRPRRGPAAVDGLASTGSSTDSRGVSRAMYAVIRTGGKQYKVEAGEQLEVERLGLDDGSEVELAPSSWSTARPCSPRPPSSTARW